MVKKSMVYIYFTEETSVQLSARAHHFILFLFGNDMSTRPYVVAEIKFPSTLQILTPPPNYYTLTTVKKTAVIN